MKKFDVLRFSCLGLGLAIATSCGRGTEVGEDDIANATGEAMASTDEALVGAVTTHRTESWQDTFAETSGPWAAATCGFSGLDFTACAAGSRARTFGGCTLLNATWEGTVTLTFSQAACTFATSGDTITRVPNFTISGRRGRTLSVTVASGGYGQRITRGASAGSFTLATSKVKRVAIDAVGTTTLNIETSTGTAMTLTGATRTGRKLDGGTLVITDALNSKTYTLTPAAVTWDGTCNCASSGSWTGTIATTGSDSTTTITVAITACGSADVTLGTETTSVTLDRCASL